MRLMALILMLMSSSRWVCTGPWLVSAYVEHAAATRSLEVANRLAAALPDRGVKLVETGFATLAGIYAAQVDGARITGSMHLRGMVATMQYRQHLRARFRLDDPVDRTGLQAVQRHGFGVVMHRDGCAVAEKAGLPINMRIASP